MKIYFNNLLELSKHEGEMEELKESLRHVKKEVSSETRRRKEVEKALEEVVTENQQLEDKIMRLEHDHGQLQMEIHNVQVRSIKVHIVGPLSKHQNLTLIQRLARTFSTTCA